MSGAGREDRDVTGLSLDRLAVVAAEPHQRMATRDAEPSCTMAWVMQIGEDAVAPALAPAVRADTFSSTWSGSAPSTSITRVDHQRQVLFGTDPSSSKMKVGGWCARAGVGHRRLRRPVAGLTVVDRAFTARRADHFAAQAGQMTIEACLLAPASDRRSA